MIPTRPGYQAKRDQMLRKYRNSLVSLIQKATLDPREFRAIDQDTAKDQRLRVQVGDTDLHFTCVMDYVDGERCFYYLCSEYVRNFPAPNYVQPGQYHNAADFDEVERKFSEWLSDEAARYLEDKQELEEDKSLPDLWAELDLLLGSSEEIQSLRNSRFSESEQRRIAESLNQIQQEIKLNHLLDDEQTQLLAERVEYLEQASRRIGRKDWLMAAAGAIIGFTLQAGLNSSTASQIINLSGDALSWISHVPKLLL
jgi:hypothetical protein